MVNNESKWKEMFDKFDTDHDGFISQTELTEGLKSEGA